MNRMQLVELEDLPWWPAVWRDAGTAYLAKAAQLAGHAKPVAKIAAEALAKSGQTEILDLCSGGGGPTAALLAELERGGAAVKVRLSDRYPNLPALERVAAESNGRIEVVRDPVDATAVPKDLPGLRTLFNAFHHFPPDLARSILAAAVRDGKPIAVVEMIGRKPPMLLGMLLAPLFFALSLPLLRPFRAAWIPFTYVVPILPLWVMFDGIVSCLRVYSPAELRELVAGIDAPGWRWDIREEPIGPGATATVLIGLPPAT
jgi:hypothetical protein